jgi:hypothetical protein
MVVQCGNEPDLKELSVRMEVLDVRKFGTEYEEETGLGIQSLPKASPISSVQRQSLIELQLL